jgi:glucose 1-dehydrogenase
MNTTKDKQKLSGQSALVTGGNTGIGKAVAMALGRAGCNVAIDYIARENLAMNLATDIRSLGVNAVAIKADVTREDQVEQMFERAISEFGTIDILVNNAGIQRDAPLVEMSMEYWQKVIDVNLTGYFLCAREAAREFIRRGIVRERSTAAGKIICVSSVHEVIPWAGHCNYAASKGGVLLLMKTLAQELAPYKIRVNSICPGAIRTDINRKAWEREQDAAKLVALIPYGRIGAPEDIGQAAAWLASDDSDYITGASVFVDGGMTLYPGFAEGG